jgi:hypothetical protein
MVTISVGLSPQAVSPAATLLIERSATIEHRPAEAIAAAMWSYEP